MNIGEYVTFNSKPIEGDNYEIRGKEIILKGLREGLVVIHGLTEAFRFSFQDFQNRLHISKCSNIFIESNGLGQYAPEISIEQSDNITVNKYSGGINAGELDGKIPNKKISVDNCKGVLLSEVYSIGVFVDMSTKVEINKSVLDVVNVGMSSSRISKCEIDRLIYYNCDLNAEISYRGNNVIKNNKVGELTARGEVKAEALLGNTFRDINLGIVVGGHLPKKFSSPLHSITLDNFGTYRGKVYYLPYFDLVIAGCWGGTLEEFKNTVKDIAEESLVNEKSLYNADLVYDLFVAERDKVLRNQVRPIELVDGRYLGLWSINDHVLDYSTIHKINKSIKELKPGAYINW